MLAQRIRHSIVIEENQSTQNGYGETVAGWTAVATVRAGYRAQTGREFLTGGANVAEAPVVFDIRYRDGITPQMRVSFDGAYYDIHAVVDPQGRQRALELHCTAGQTP